MKKRNIIIAILITVLIVPLTVNADSESFDSYLDMATNTTLTGSTRKYRYDNHKISLSEITATGTDHKIVIAINKPGLFSSTQQKRLTLSYTVGQTNTAYMGNVGSGKRFYTFGTYQNALTNGSSGHGNHYSGIRANKVISYSYS